MNRETAQQNSLLKFLMAVLLIVVVTELVQLWVPDRAFNLFDMVSNVTGVVVGTGIIFIAQRRSGTVV